MARITVVLGRPHVVEKGEGEGGVGLPRVEAGIPLVWAAAADVGDEGIEAGAEAPGVRVGPEPVEESVVDTGVDDGSDRRGGPGQPGTWVAPKVCHTTMSVSPSRPPSTIGIGRLWRSWSVSSIRPPQQPGLDNGPAFVNYEH